jgi:hypothetical protein
MEVNCPSCEEAILISDEDMYAPSLECPFCQQHIEIEKPEPPPAPGSIEKPPPTIQPQPLSSERNLLEWGGVKVTDKRVIIGSRTYACKQISSVGIAHDFKGEKLLFGKPVVLVGFLSWIPAVLTFLLMAFSGATTLASVLFGVSMLAGLLITLMCMGQSGLPRYWIEVATTSGREQVLQFESQIDAQKVYAAINTAIIDN